MSEAVSTAAREAAPQPIEIPAPRYPEFDPQAHVVTLSGKRYWHDTRGALVPENLVSAKDKLIDEVVRKQVHFALDLSDQVARFKGYCFAEIAGLVALLEQEYQANPGGEKGNATFRTVDGCQKVTIQIADRMVFGPEIRVAKSLIDECLKEWSSDANDVIRALIERVFNVDKEDQIDRAAFFQLMRLDVAEPRWQRAMQAVRDSIQISGTTRYIRFHWREAPDAPWSAITIDIASAPVGAAMDGRS